MKIEIDRFRVREGKRVRLKDQPTDIKDLYRSKDDYQEILATHVRELSELQTLLYAHHRYSFLLIFQAMDAAGKDSCIKHVMSGVNPQGCQVHSFRRPSGEERDHDFLWRTTRALPERGHIGIFNRSYYEEVLVVKVHPEFLRGQGLPDELLNEKTVWDERYRSIRDLESHLQRNGTRIAKVFLHVSKEEQRRRFLKRIDEADKNWKFNVEDMAERKFWKDYMKAYEDCMEATSTKESPWYVVPADDKKDAQIVASQIVLDSLRKLKMSFPNPEDAERKKLLGIRKELQ